MVAERIIAIGRLELVRWSVAWPSQPLVHAVRTTGRVRGHHPMERVITSEIPGGISTDRVDLGCAIGAKKAAGSKIQDLASRAPRLV